MMTAAVFTGDELCKWSRAKLPRICCLRQGCCATHGLLQHIDRKQAQASGATSVSTEFSHSAQLLLQFCSKLEFHTHSLQRELLCKILAQHVWLVPRFLQQSNQSLDPRASVRWVANVGLLTHIFPLFAEANAARNHAHIGLGAADLAAALLPACLGKSVFNNGLQHENRLVVYFTLQLLHAAMQCVQTQLDSLPADAGETGFESIEAVQDQLRKRLPDFQVLVTLYATSAQATAASGTEHDGRILAIHHLTLKVIGSFVKQTPQALVDANIDLVKLFRPNIALLHSQPQLQHSLLQASAATVLSPWDVCAAVIDCGLFVPCRF
jgi:hypothetical protein